MAISDCRCRVGWSDVGGTTFLDAAQTVLLLEAGPDKNDWGWADETPGFVAWKRIMTRPALTMKAMAPFQSHATDRPNPPSEAHPPCQHGLLSASRQGADQYEDGRTLAKSVLPRGAQL
jgi:hypothetical protein